MESDSETALERVQSEALGTLMSIQSYREVDRAYFDRLRDAVSAAVAFFKADTRVPGELISELEGSARILRNEATAFPGRTAACMEMADWLEGQRQQLS
jgi:hypothetical protein